MRIGVFVVLACAIEACRLNPQCFGTDECSTGQVCVNGACVASSTRLDADPDPDAAIDASTDAAIDAGVDAAPDASEDASLDAAIDAGACPPLPGRVLPDDQNVFGDELLFHFEDNIQVAREAEDSAAPDQNATCTGAGCPTSEMCGAYGAAAAFDGSDELSILTPYAFGDRASFSIEAWIRPTGPRNEFACILEYLDNEMGIPGGDLAFCLDPLGFLAMPGATGTREIMDGAWTHVAVIRYGGMPNSVSFFVDGQPAGGPFAIAMPRGSSFGRMRIGRSFPGLIDELRLANHNLAPTVDFSVNRKDTVLTWSAGDDVWIADELGAGARVFIPNASYGRWTHDSGRFAFLRESAPDAWDLWVADRDGMNQMMIATAVAPVQGVWNQAGTRFYFVRGEDCTQTVHGITVGTMNESPVTEISGLHVVSLDVGFALPAPTEQLVFAWDDCATVSGVSELAGNVVRDIYTSTVANERFTTVRTAPCECTMAPCTECTLQVVLTRVVGGVPQAELGDRNGASTEVIAPNRRGFEYALRNNWFYILGDPDDAGLGFVGDQVAIIDRYFGGAAVLTNYGSGERVDDVDFAYR